MLRFLRDLHTQSEIAAARLWLDSFPHTSIPRSNFDISYSRSSGPGGQKVNKTSSKATVAAEPHVWLNPHYCSWIPGPIRDQIAQKKLRYETKHGGILIQSDTSRSREVNTDECFRKLLHEIKTIVHFEGEVSSEDKKKWAALAVELKKRRLEDKKRQSEKKKLRLKSFDL